MMFYEGYQHKYLVEYKELKVEYPNIVFGYSTSMHDSVQITGILLKPTYDVKWPFHDHPQTVSKIGSIS